MGSTSAHGDDRTFHDTCRQVVRNLIAHYDWSLLTEEDLMTRILVSNRHEDPPAGLERLVKNHMVMALYEACHPTAAPDQRERGYTELHRFLYRAARQRWPDQAEDVAQQTLLMVYEQFDRCRSPVAFLAFALGLLRWAYQKETGKTERTVGLTAANLRSSEPDVADMDEPLLARERLRAVHAALQSLPPKQQQTIALKYLHGWSDEAIGQHLQTSAGNVRVIRYRALQHLRQHTSLQEYLEKET